MSVIGVIGTDVGDDHVLAAKGSVGVEDLVGLIADREGHVGANDGQSEFFE